MSTKKLQQDVLQLYFKSNDNRIKTISELLGSNQTTVTIIIEKYFNKEIFFNPPEYYIYHSKINIYK